MRVDDISELVKTIRSIAKDLNEYSESHATSKIPDDDPKLNNVLGRVAAVQERMKALGVKPPPTEGKEVEFSAFFSSVGRALVDAQELLDRHSEDYLRSIGGRSHILPSVFRIPKLSAEIKFALKEATGEKVNLVFYSTQSEAETLHQQSVQFDIVSIPPPHVQNMTGLAPRVGLILSSPSREAVFEGITKFLLPGDLEGEQTEKQVQKSYLLKNRDQVLIVEIEPLKRFYLLYAEEAAPKCVGVWRLSVEPLVLEVVLRFTRSLGDAGNEELLHDDVLNFGCIQEKLLKGLG
jgi:hypothetical protein